MKINCLIVDDEELAQRLVEKYVADIPELNLIAKCDNAMEASSALRQNDIDLIFLDINMPKISGLNFLKGLKNPPMVIIATAYREYAVEGFELDVVDYLNKPFSFDRFFRAVNKVIDKMQLQKSKHDNYILQPEIRRQIDESFIFIKSDKITYKIDYKDILYIESVGDYVKIITAEKVTMAYQSLKHLETLLPSKYFPRVHKSFMVSVSKINSIEGNMIKIGETVVPIGRSYKLNFTNIIESFSGN